MKPAEVISKREKKAFHDTARIIYSNDPVWVCPLEKEIESIFDPSKNTFFKHGTATRWVLYDSGHKPAGRIAAFIDFNSSAGQDQPTGGIGFFECVNDRDSAFLLFDTAKNWLKEKGMEAMDGPINFGETDKYWGLLVEGFTHPSYEIAYNPPYYQELFEAYGFQTYYKQEGFHLDVKKELPERFLKVADWITRKPDYAFRHFEWKRADLFVKDFVDVYNEAWASFKENFKPMEAAYVKKTLQKAKAIIDEEFIWLAYFKDKPVAIYLMWPDVNLILRHLNGKLSLLAMLKFLYLKKRKTITRARGVLMGVIPSFQGKGVESGIILNIAQTMKQKPHYTEIEFSWGGDFNPKMRKIFIGVGSESVKHYITYRYLFDRTKEFKRFPIPEE
ncbi:MAG: GNAT family N-acetyltransferase [Bacteroidales bacterium]|nr:GNAT family N-acetyltransferase [Bacteroidales bacterium]